MTGGYTNHYTITDPRLSSAATWQRAFSLPTLSRWTVYFIVSRFFFQLKDSGSNGVTVSTLDFESSDGGLNPPWSFFYALIVRPLHGAKFFPAIDTTGEKLILVGLEPTISGSVDRCLIHWATGPVRPVTAHTLRSIF